MHMKSNTKIPEKQYVALIKRSNSYMPSALMTPYGTDKSSKQRMDTIDRNVRYGALSGKFSPCVIENTALSGFKFTKTVYNNTGVDTWTIEDPRGFVYDISVDNASEIVTTTTIENGEILSPCVWGRRGTNNVLISVDSNEYKQAVSNTSAANSKASWRDVKIGDTILLRNNVKGIWFGKLYPMFYIYTNAYRRPAGPASQHPIEVSNIAYHVIYINHSLCIIKSPQLSKIIDTSNRLELKQAEQMVNDLISDKNCGEISKIYQKIIAMSYDRNMSFTTKSMPITMTNEQELCNLLEQGQSNPWVFCNSKSGIFGKLKLNPPNRYITAAIVEKIYAIIYSKSEFEKNQLCRMLEPPKSTLANPTKQYGNEIQTVYNFNSDDEFSILSFQIDTALGNSFELDSI